MPPGEKANDEAKAKCERRRDNTITIAGGILHGYTLRNNVRRLRTPSVKGKVALDLLLPMDNRLCAMKRVQGHG